jgi:hypothetical protein
MKTFFRRLLFVFIAVFLIATISSPDFIIRDYTSFGVFQILTNDDYTVSGYIGDGGEQLNSSDGAFSIASGYFAQVRNVQPTKAVAFSEYTSLLNSSVSKTQVKWSIVQGVVEYQLEWDSVSVDPFISPVGDTTITTAEFTFPELAYNSSYSWRVRAISTTGVPGAWSPTYIITTQIRTPEILDIGSENSTLLLNWTEIEGATSYSVFIATLDQELLEVGIGDLSISGTSGTVTGLTPGETYNVAVQGVKLNWGASDTSNVETITLKSAPVTSLSVTPVKVNNSNSKKVRLEWTNPIGKWDSVRIERSRSGTNSFSTITSFTQNTPISRYEDVDDRLIQNTDYVYRVSTVNSQEVTTSIDSIITTRPNLPLISNSEVKGVIEKTIGDTITVDFRVAVPTGDISLIRLFYSLNNGATFSESTNTNVHNQEFSNTQNLTLEWYSSQDVELQNLYSNNILIRVEAYVQEYDDFNLVELGELKLDNQSPEPSSNNIVAKSIPWNKMELSWEPGVDSSAVTYTLIQKSPEEKILASNLTTTSYPIDFGEDDVEKDFEFQITIVDAFGNKSSFSELNGDSSPGYVGDYDNDARIDATDLFTFALSWGGDEGQNIQTANLFPHDGDDYPNIKPRQEDDILDVRDLATFVGMWNSLINSPVSKTIALSDYPEIESFEVQDQRSFLFQPVIDLDEKLQFVSFEIRYSNALNVDSLSFLKDSPFKLSYLDSVNSRAVIDFVYTDGWNAAELPIINLYFSSVDDQLEETLRFSVATKAGSGFRESSYEDFKVYEVIDIPDEFSLAQNYPNPFNPSTKINFKLPVDSDVQLRVFDLLGRHISTLASGELKAGSHTVTFDASNFSSGMYFYQIIAGDFVQVQKMMLIK